MRGLALTLAAMIAPVLCAAQEGDAVAALAAPTGAAPLTEAELNRFRAVVTACWAVPADGEVAVTVGFALDTDGRVIGNRIDYVAHAGGTPAELTAAFEAARRAILRCMGDGYALPPEKYAHWRYVEMTFDPAGWTIQ